MDLNVKYKPIEKCQGKVLKNPWNARQGEEFIDLTPNNYPFI